MKFLKNLRVSRRVFAVFAVVIILYISNIAYNIYSLSMVKGNVEAIYNEWLLSINYLLQSDRDGYQARIETGVSLALGDYAKGREYQEQLNTKFAVVDENLQQLNDRFKKFKEIYVKVVGDENEYFDVFDKEYQNIVAYTADIKQHLADYRDDKAGEIFFGKYTESFETLRNSIDQLTQISEEEAKSHFEQSMARAQEIENFAFIFFGGILLIMIWMGILLTKSIVQQLGCEPTEAADIARRLSEGDLDIKFDDRDKGLYFDLKNMVGRLKGIITDVINSAENVSSASVQMSSVSQQLSQGANEQAASAEEVNSSMDEMSSNIQQNTENARQTEKIAVSAASSVKDASDVVNNTVQSMNTIADKISIIGEIARQTNILALNAAVEAARAGEHGKGFAVVAAEVRKLAERSQTAAAEIDELSKSSVSVAEKSGVLLNDLVPDIEKTSRLVQEIAAGSEEQNDSSKQINTAIQQLNQIIQQNAASAEEMASGSEELSAQADTLKELVAFFKISAQRREQVSSRHQEFKIETAKPEAPKKEQNGHAKENGYAFSSKNGKKNGVAISLSDDQYSDDEFENF